VGCIVLWQRLFASTTRHTRGQVLTQSAL